MNRKKQWCVFVIILVALVSCGGPQVSKEPVSEALEEETARNQKAADEPDDAGRYRVSSGDLLEVVTWREPDLTKEVMVRIDGMITFPLLGDIKAAGRTPTELKEAIQSRLQEYVKDPRVTVTVKDARSQRFYIIGEIAKTGAYPMNKPLTVLQAFALAGGFTEWANKKEIIVIRHDEGKEKVIDINYYDLIEKKGLLRQNIWIESNDTIVVP